MKKPTKDEETLGSLLVDVSAQVIELTWAYSVWWVVADKSNQADFQQVMEAYPNYFRATFAVFQTGFFVTAHRLFDSEKRSLSLRSLIRLLEPSNPIHATALHKKLLENDALLKKVLLLRHNVYGHRSRSISPAAVFADLKIKPKEMKAVLQLAQEVTVELALELGVRQSQMLAEQFRQCERDIRDETLMVLAGLKERESA